MTFWVDPLDGSSGLTQGHTEHLTCIIGVSLFGRPILGVVHKPFIEETSTHTSHTVDSLTSTGRTYVGLAESGLFTIDTSNK